MIIFPMSSRSILYEEDNEHIMQQKERSTVLTKGTSACGPQANL